jgi:transcriptional regulator with XRE-family HTH domain/Zn-dependent peptidase ImmA (M78 family)
MITNERQYRITKAETDRFRDALSKLTAHGDQREGVHPLLVKAERDALRSQLDDLAAELREYEALKAGGVSIIKIDSFSELAEGLIKARIAAGLSQKALADRLHLKEQQVQRYEAERYASASLQRLQEVAQAIGVQIRKEILMPLAPRSFRDLTTKLRQIGLDRDFLLSRLLPSRDAAKANGDGLDSDDAVLTAKAGEVLGRVFGWPREALLGAEPLAGPRFAAAEARFKMPARRAQSATSLYAAYANYLAIIVLRACEKLPEHHVPAEAKEFRRALLASYGALSLQTALRFSWDLGIPVLPLKDPGTFHGACWRYEGRNVIVLKQASKHEARWLFDLIHELLHAAKAPEAPTLEVIEADETSEERRNSTEEVEASQFAGDVTLDGRAEELAQACVKAARGSVERLKQVVPSIAERSGVSVGALANYMAFRLSWQNISWWGTAANLQKEDADPYTVARAVFLERFPFSIESTLDRELLERALH